MSFTAVLSPSNLPSKPTIWAPSAYKTVSRLVSLRFIHGHNHISDNMKKDGWAELKTDPKRWSQIKKVYERVKLRMKEIDVCPNDNSEWVRAAWLETHEKREKSMPIYIFLRNNYYSKRK